MEIQIRIKQLQKHFLNTAGVKASKKKCKDILILSGEITGKLSYPWATADRGCPGIETVAETDPTALL